MRLGTIDWHSNLGTHCIRISFLTLYNCGMTTNAGVTTILTCHLSTLLELHVHVDIKRSSSEFDVDGTDMDIKRRCSTSPDSYVDNMLFDVTITLTVRRRRHNHLCNTLTSPALSPDDPRHRCSWSSNVDVTVIATINVTDVIVVRRSHRRRRCCHQTPTSAL